MSEIQLTNASGYNTKNMIFSTPLSGNVKDTTIKFRRIPISTKYPDGTTGDLILPTERLFSFGVCENISPETKKSNGFVFPLVLYSKEGATQAEKDFLETFNNIIDECKKYLLDNKKELKLHDLEPALLKKFNPVWIKKDDEGNPVEGSLPTLYVKLIVSKKDKQEKIVSNFYDKKSGKQLNPMELLKQYCYTNAAIKIESIFLGKNLSMQIKLYEADVELLNSNKKRLLPRPQSDATVTVSTSKTNPLADDDNDDVNSELDEQDSGSVNSDVEEDEEEVKPPPKKPVPKRVPPKKK